VIDAGAAHWWPTLATILVLLLYQVLLAVAERINPLGVARSSHAHLRSTWFDAIARREGSEILAVQTLRNSLMSATMTASTAALALMGSITLAAPSFNSMAGSGATTLDLLTPRHVLELVLLLFLFVSLVSSVMSVRYYTHASFIAGMPADSLEKRAWIPVGENYVRKAGLFYSTGLRYFVLIAPVVVAIVHPIAGPVAAILVTAVLYSLDQNHPVET
jgi:hypothetical protein